MNTSQCEYLFDVRLRVIAYPCKACDGILSRLILISPVPGWRETRRDLWFERSRVDQKHAAPFGSKSKLVSYDIRFSGYCQLPVSALPTAWFPYEIGDIGAVR